MQPTQTKPTDAQRFAPPPNNKSKEPAKKGSTLGGIIVIIVFIAIIVGVIMALTGGSKKPATKNTASTASTTNTSANTTGDKISAWNSQYGSVFTTLGNDLGTFSKDATAGNVTAAGADCQKFENDLTTAQGYPAIPDSTVEQHWSSALSDFSAGAQDCVQGVNNNDTTLITQANNEFTQGNTQVTDTTNAIKQASGQ